MKNRTEQGQFWWDLMILLLFESYGRAPSDRTRENLIWGNLFCLEIRS